MAKKLSWILATLIFLFLGGPLNAQSKIDELEQYDLRAYSPINYGLKDLVFEARISNLQKLLEEQYNLKNLIDVYYKIYWIFPGQYKIEVEGIPEGFVDLKLELRELIKDKLEFVVPMPFAAKIRGYELSYKSKSPKVLIEGVDRGQTREINRIEIEMDNNGKLLSLSGFGPRGMNRSEFDLNIKPWSHNKWVVDTFQTVTPFASGEVRVIHEVSYESQAGIGLPSEIDVKTVQKVEVPIEEGKTETKKMEMGSKIVFTKYEINTGKAQRYITQGIQR